MRFTTALATLFFVSTALALPKGRKEAAVGKREDEKDVPICKGDENEGLVQAGKVTAIGTLEYRCIDGQPEVTRPVAWTGLTSQGPKNLWGVVHDVLRDGPTKAQGIECVNITETSDETTITFRNLLNATQTGEFEMEKLCSSPPTEDGPVITQYRITDTKNSSSSPFGKSKIVTLYLKDLHKEASDREILCEAADEAVNAAGVAGVKGLAGWVESVPLGAVSTVELIFWEPNVGEEAKDDKEDQKDEQEQKDEDGNKEGEDRQKPGL